MAESDKDEASQQVVLMAKRCALLYQVFAEAMVEELGEEKGNQAIQKAILRYGAISGFAVRKAVQEMGLDPSIENYAKVPDLPQTGWVTQQKSLTQDRLEVDVLYCPLAEQWLKGGLPNWGASTVMWIRLNMLLLTLI